MDHNTETGRPPEPIEIATAEVFVRNRNGFIDGELSVNNAHGTQMIGIRLSNGRLINVPPGKVWQSHRESGLCILRVFVDDR